MSKFWHKADRSVEAVLLIGCTPTFLILIAIIALFRSCVGYGVDDIDNSYMVQRYMYDRIIIKDSTGNGYELLWYTTNAVTDRRYEEIKSRQHIRESYDSLKRSAANHFQHDLINTDIYDFVEYAKSFDIDSMDVRLVNIWVYGKDYAELYRRPHPDYPDGVDSSDKIKGLGELFLKENDVYPYNIGTRHIYRYWGCDATSLTDERYTHITEQNRTQYKD